MYATVGYTTVYLYYAYPQNSRPRISQMLILPPFQGMGIGAEFIQIIYKKFQNDPKVIDITVEDPSDDFRRVRNYVDAKLCRTLPEFAPEQLRKGFSKEMAKAAKEKFKVIENENAYFDWKANRLLIYRSMSVKAVLSMRYYDWLKQMWSTRPNTRIIDYV